MERVFAVLNELEKIGTIRGYALGGATALLFYAEPATTYDIDVFAFLPEKGGLVDLSTLYQTLRKMGYAEKDEHVIIEGFPVQFLPTDVLIEDGVTDAVTKYYQNTPVKVLKLEYLMAEMLRNGRPKDRERLALLLEDETPFDKKLFDTILNTYNLVSKWERLRENQE